MLELMSCFHGISDYTPLPSYRCGKAVGVERYGRALQAIREVVAKSGRNPKQFALNSLRIGGATSLVAGGGFRNDLFRERGGGVRRVQDIHACSRRVSRRLAVANMANERQPGEGEEIGSKIIECAVNGSLEYLAVAGIEWYGTIRGLGHRRQL